MSQKEVVRQALIDKSREQLLDQVLRLDSILKKVDDLEVELGLEKGFSIADRLQRLTKAILAVHDGTINQISKHDLVFNIHKDVKQIEQPKRHIERVRR